jgi:hypothetical protein
MQKVQFKEKKQFILVIICLLFIITSILLTLTVLRERSINVQLAKEKAELEKLFLTRERLQLYADWHKIISFYEELNRKNLPEKTVSTADIIPEKYQPEIIISFTDSGPEGRDDLKLAASYRQAYSAFNKGAYQESRQLLEPFYKAGKLGPEGLFLYISAFVNENPALAASVPEILKQLENLPVIYNRNGELAFLRGLMLCEKGLTAEGGKLLEEAALAGHKKARLLSGIYKTDDKAFREVSFD